MEEFSSGCESGWTAYFEQSRPYSGDDGCVNLSSSEDLSMVSDASSGPAQVSQDDHATRNCYMNNNSGGMFICSVSTDEDAALGKKPRRRGRQARRGGKAPDDDDRQQLDDTASSRPDFNYNNNYSSSTVMDFAQDHFSGSYFQAGASSTHYDQVPSHQPDHWY